MCSKRPTRTGSAWNTCSAGTPGAGLVQPGEEMALGAPDGFQCQKTLFQEGCASLNDFGWEVIAVCNIAAMP